MNCFNHPDKIAIGICKWCSKGLCKDCASDLEFGLACKGKHESQIVTLNKMIEQNAKAHAAAPKNILIAPLFYLFMGLVFAVSGFQDGITDFAFIMGIGFITFGVIIFIRNKAIIKSTDNLTHETQ